MYLYNKTITLRNIRALHTCMSMALLYMSLVTNIASLVVKAAYFVPRRAKRGVYRHEKSAESAFFVKMSRFFAFRLGSLASVSTIYLEILVIMID